MPMVMEYPIKERTVIDIQATVKKYSRIIPAMLAAHALTGYDTVPAYIGIGKGTMLKILKRVFPLNVLLAILMLFGLMSWNKQHISYLHVMDSHSPTRCQMSGLVCGGHVLADQAWFLTTNYRGIH